MTVKKDVVRDGGKNKNTKQEKKKSSTRTSSSSSRIARTRTKTTTSETPTTTALSARNQSRRFRRHRYNEHGRCQGQHRNCAEISGEEDFDLHLRENFEGTTQNVPKSKIVTEDLPSTIKTLSKESANLTGSAMKEFNENIDADLIAQNAKKSIEGTSKRSKSFEMCKNASRPGVK